MVTSWGMPNVQVNAPLSLKPHRPHRPIPVKLDWDEAGPRLPAIAQLMLVSERCADAALKTVRMNKNLQP